MTSVKNPVLRAIRDNPGLATKIGEACGIGRSAVWMWRTVPPHHVLAVAKFMKLSPHDIRPDLYPRELLAAE
jgi:DNA-binding transcriptional regulator YdaS (Cro superfamily)